jgi:hypothetical protein
MHTALNRWGKRVVVTAVAVYPGGIGFKAVNGSRRLHGLSDIENRYSHGHIQAAGEAKRSHGGNLMDLQIKAVLGNDHVLCKKRKAIRAGRPTGAVGQASLLVRKHSSKAPEIHPVDFIEVKILVAKPYKKLVSANCFPRSLRMGPKF